jgi:glycosyltransferase involved in cell wall biosynthesis
MRVLMLNQYFHPDVAATAQLATDLAVDLAERGHEVTVVASTRQYVGGETLSRTEDYKGVRIIRVPATGFGRRSRLLRVVDYATFLAGALAPVLGRSRPDVVIALSTPPFIAALGLLAQQLRGVRLVFWVMDVYPDVAVKLGVLGSKSPATRLMKMLATMVLRRADDVIALDEAMSERLMSAGADPQRTHVIDNWCDGDAIRPKTIDGNELRAELGLGDGFTISYSGNMGLGHDFATVLDAMELLRDEHVHWLFIGDGPQREVLRRQVVERRIPHSSFLEYRPRDDLPVSLTAAHASLVTMQPDLAGLLVPSKAYGILAAGVPLVYVGPDSGRVADMVRNHGVGIDVRNGDARGLADGILRLKRNVTLRTQMAQRARDTFDARFCRSYALDRHHAVLTERVSGRLSQQPR